METRNNRVDIGLTRSHNPFGSGTHQRKGYAQLVVALNHFSPLEPPHTRVYCNGGLTAHAFVGGGTFLVRYVIHEN